MSEFDPDLYRGTAGYYDRFRLPYPRAMLDELVSVSDLSGQGRLIDLACGTGQLAFALAHEFAEVWAVDQEPDMIEVVRGKAGAAGAGPVRAVLARAEELEAPPGAFELVAIGNAFHRLRRDAVAANAHRCYSRADISRWCGRRVLGRARRTGRGCWRTCSRPGGPRSMLAPAFRPGGNRCATRGRTSKCSKQPGFCPSAPPDFSRITIGQLKS